MKEKAVITTEQEKYLLENAPELLKYRDDMDDFVTEFTFFLSEPRFYDKDDFFTDEGRVFERMYDAILDQTYEAREN